MTSPAKPINALIEGNVYVVTYKLQSGNYRWLKYESTMTYIGENKYGELNFNLRPLAGTQTLLLPSIIAVQDLGRAQGRADVRHKRPRRIGAA